MGRFFDWLQRRREAKCERDGHKVAGVTRRVYVQPAKSWRSVADAVYEERFFCRRCGEIIADWHEYRRKGIQSLTLSGDDMDALEETGRLEGRPKKTTATDRRGNDG